MCGKDLWGKKKKSIVGFCYCFGDYTLEQANKPNMNENKISINLLPDQHSQPCEDTPSPGEQQGAVQLDSSSRQTVV